MSQKANPVPLAGGNRAGIGDAGRRSDTTDWRETLARLGITVAAKADSYRLLAGADLSSLAADIDANGLRNPLVLWRAKDGDRWQLADGRNRCAAMSTLVEGDLQIEGAVSLADRREGGRIEDLIRSFNIERRHLTPDERRALIAEVIVTDPMRSDRSIAVETGYHKNTIGSVRKELETVGTVAHHDQRVGRDGVKQPASKPRRSAMQEAFNAAKRSAERQQQRMRERAALSLPPQSEAGPVPSPSLKRDALVGDVCGWLRADLRGALESLVLILRDEQSRIADLPLDKRIILAWGYLQALGVTADDLNKAVL
jgi:hypothetical protein